MAVSNPFYASFNFTEAPTFLEGVRSFISERNLIWHAVGRYWERFVTFPSQPVVYTVIIAWVIPFTIVVTKLLNLGFGPIGIVASSPAAGFQARQYRGLVPAAGLFATLTSLAMRGILQLLIIGFGACVATLVAMVAWVYVRTT